jgi:hypothetical protein
MKSFSSSSFASENAVALEFAADAVKDNPYALFTDFQWFLLTGRDTVFFTAFSKTRFDEPMLQDLVAKMVSLAPQLTHGFKGARPGYPFPQRILEEITSVEEVDSFAGYPDKWLSASQDVFEHPDLPLFRVMVANLRGGPDAEGRASIIQVRSAHCLMEGSDAALLTRSQTANHGIQSDKGKSEGWLKRFRGGFRGTMMAWIYSVAGNLLNAPERPLHYRTLAISRQRVRLLASKLGIRQRSLYFALVTHALHSEKDRRLKEKVITSAYTMLDTKRTASDDDFFRVRALEAKFPFSPDFLTYAKAVDKVIGATEDKDITKFQLTVLGAFHQSTNISTFCPGRDYMTISFVVEQRHLESIDRIEKLIGELELSQI